MKPGIHNQDRDAPVALCSLGENKQGVREALELCDGFNDLDPNMSVLVKPNLVVWLDKFPYAPYGVITTSSVVEEVVKLLKDRGVKNITVGDGCAQNKDFGSTTQNLFDGLNYHAFEKKYGVKLVDFNTEKHQKLSLGPHTLKIAQPMFECDYLINLPALKTHEGTRVTLGFKNLKGSLSVKSKQSCHNPDHPVDEYILHLAERFYPNLTIIDGTYMLEAGPMFTGTAHRADLVIAGKDMYSVDVVGSSLLGVPVTDVLHLRKFSKIHGRSTDVKDIQIKGLKLEEHVHQIKIDTPYSEDGRKPISFIKQNLEGFDLPFPIGVCTGCTYIFPPTMLLILSANEGKPFDDIELLAKGATPSGTAKKTFLLGKCPIDTYKDDKRLNEVVEIPGCPPRLDHIVAALRENGINVNMAAVERFFGYLVKRYDKQNLPKEEYWIE
ncbi:MAG: DUF362 domain-containing protein [Desulfobacterales bacterium]